jgi:hypothetical protein
MSQQPPADLVADLALALEPHYGQRARALARELGPVLLRIAAGEGGMASLNRCLDAQGLDVDLFHILAGADFRKGDYRITFRKGNLLGVVTFEDLEHNHVTAIKLGQVVPAAARPAPQARAAPSPPSPLQRFPVPLAIGAAGLACVVIGAAALGQPGIRGAWSPMPTAVVKPAAQAPGTPVTISGSFSGGRNTLVAPAQPAPAAPLPTPAPLIGATAPQPPTLAGLAVQRAPTIGLLLAPGTALEQRGWAVSFGGADFVRSFLITPAGAGTIQEHVIMPVRVWNTTGVEQPIPRDLLLLRTPVDQRFPDPELSDRYGRANGTVRILGSDPVPSDGAYYITLLAFEVPPGTTGLALHLPGDTSMGWLVR